MDQFNPYQQWLGLSPQADAPSHYQLLGLEPLEGDSQRISRAADAAIARVRSARPGDQAAAWAKLLDELEDVRSCLLDPQQKSAYDAQLRGAEVEAATPVDEAEEEASPATQEVPIERWPPGMAPPGATPRPAAPAPIAKESEAPHTTTPQGPMLGAPNTPAPAAPSQPIASPAPPGPSAPTQVPSPAQTPTGPQPAPQAAPSAPAPPTAPYTVAPQEAANGPQAWAPSPQATRFANSRCAGVSAAGCRVSCNAASLSRRGACRCSSSRSVCTCERRFASRAASSRAG